MNERTQKVTEQLSQRFQDEYQACFENFDDHESRMTCTERASENKYQEIDGARQRAKEYYESTRLQRQVKSVFCD